jgi:hypothetical protein
MPQQWFRRGKRYADCCNARRCKENASRRIFSSLVLLYGDEIFRVLSAPHFIPQ